MPDSSTTPTKPAAHMAEGYKLLKDRHYLDAARAFEHAALAGLVEAQYELAMLYEKGMGVRTDSAKARKLYEKAANQDHVLAAEKMAEYTAEGIGGDKHLDESRQWKEKAQSLKDEKEKAI